MILGLFDGLLTVEGVTATFLHVCYLRPSWSPFYLFPLQFTSGRKIVSWTSRHRKLDKLGVNFALEDFMKLEWRSG